MAGNVTGQGGGTAQAGTQGQEGAGQAQEQGQGETPAVKTWDEWLASRTDEEKAVITPLLEQHTAGLKTALQNERAERAKLEKDVRSLAKKSEAGSEAEKQLTALADQLSAANSRADFFEQATRPEIGVVDARLAWLVVSAPESEFVNSKGVVNWTALKEQHPALFAKAGTQPTPKGNAGTGTGSSPAGPADMNTLIRRKAGRE